MTQRGVGSAMWELSRDRLLLLHRHLAHSRAATEGLRALIARPIGVPWTLSDHVTEAGIVAAGSALRGPPDDGADLALQSVLSPGLFLIMGGTLEALFQTELALGVRGLGIPSLFGPVPCARSLVDVGAGMAMAMDRTGKGGVVMAFCPEGTPSLGAWHEGVNFAAVRRASLVVVVEQRGNVRDPRVPKHTRLESYTRVLPGYGIDGLSVDATDLSEVSEAARTLVARARAGKGTQLLELRRDEAFPDDPLLAIRRRLEDEGHRTAQELDDEVEAAFQLVDEAVKRILGELDEDSASAIPSASGPVPGREVWGDVVLREPWWRTEEGEPRQPHVAPRNSGAGAGSPAAGADDPSPETS